MFKFCWTVRLGRPASRDEHGDSSLALGSLVQAVSELPGVVNALIRLVGLEIMSFRGILPHNRISTVIF